MQLNFGIHEQEGNEMIRELARELGDVKDLDRAKMVLHSVLSAIRRRLGFDRAKHFMDHLPQTLQTIYVSDWQVEKELPEDLSGMDDFIMEVKKSGTYLSDFIEVDDAIHATRAVFKIIRKHTSEKDLKAILDLLPRDMSECLEDLV